MRNVEVNDHYLPVEIADSLKEFFPEHADLSYEEFLVQQESVYESLKENGRNGGWTSNRGHSSDLSSQVSGLEGESSRIGSASSQLALDEALARSLQELGDDFEDFYISKHSGTASDSSAGSRNVVHSPPQTPTRQLQSLGDTVGRENKGLSEDFISRLPTYKYKVGMFSKKKKKDDCVICTEEYKNGDRLTTLPCAHQYHSGCITRWLKQNKACPVCQTDLGDV